MKYIGPPIKESLKKYAGLSDELAEEATKYYREIYVNKYIVKSFLYDGMLELLFDLKKEGYGISIATMKTKKQIDKLFEIVAIDKQLFDIIETALDNGKLKKSEMLKNIKNASVNHSVVMIGDTEGDRKAAEEAGVRFVGVTYGYGFLDEKTYPFYVAKNINELKTAIHKEDS